MTQKKIIRAYTGSQLRAEDDSRTLSGYPIVFGERSVVLPDNEYGMVVEVIERNAISEELIAACDIVANINHDDNRMIGRSVGGKGSLSLTIDDHGVLMSLEAPHTVYGDIAYEGAKRGDFKGMSFAFWLLSDEDVTYTKEKGDGGKPVYVRHVNNIRGLMDVSVVTHPAYPTTEVEARAIGAEIRKAFKTKEEPEENTRSAAMIADYDKISEFINNRNF